MEKRLRSSLQSSPEVFLSSATKLGLRPAKTSLKALIWSISPSSDLSSSLPIALENHISRSINSFQKLLDPKSRAGAPSRPSPPAKRLRRSARRSKTRVESKTEDHESQTDQDKHRVLLDLQVLAYIVSLCVSHPKNAFAPSDLLSTIRTLHDNLILFESDSVLLSEVASLCEEWWKKELPGREILISQSIPFLLSRSLTLHKKVDVHRVYMLREALTLFDFDDESIEDLKFLLVRCLITPLYLKTEEGKRFMAFMFGLSRQLLKEALAMIRSQILFGKKSMLEAYADIVFRAWKAAEGALRDEIENEFLQGLIEGAIHASSGSFAASIRKILDGFINQRTVDGVEKLLFRLAEPVLFRSLQVSNSNVRLNALYLLLDLFPLEDPDATKEVKDTLLDKQFFLLERLLIDDCPDVRVVAVEGSCRILHLFWEVIPSSIITRIITKIFDDMSHDICNEVRVATLNGIIYLLGNPQSHEVLKVLLSRLGNLILDSCLSVRIAVVDLLLLLRDTGSFQFHKVVTLDALLSSLANDQQSVAQKITRLLIPSYFPSRVTVVQACNRCITLIKRSPMAGARFCEFALSEGASLKSLIELVRVLIDLTLSPDKLDAALTEGFLVASAYLCKDLATEAIYKATLKELFSGGKLKHLLAAASTAHAQASVLDIVLTICPDDGAEILEECINQVTNCTGVSKSVEMQAEVRSAHKLVLSCGWFHRMFEVLIKLLQKTAFECHTNFGTNIPKSSLRILAKRKRICEKKSSYATISAFEDDYTIAVGISWQIKDLLAFENTRKVLLGSQDLGPAFFALKVISEVSIVQSIQCNYMDISPVLAYMALAVHVTLQSVSIHDTVNYDTNMTDRLDSSGSYFKGTILDQTMDHLLYCTEKLLGASNLSNYGKLPSESKQDSSRVTRQQRQKCRESQTDVSSPSDSGKGSSLTIQKRISNAVKMLSAVFKFIVDAATLRLVSHRQEKCLVFALEYIQYISSTLRHHFQAGLQFKEEDSRETFLSLKSSVTYAAKLLNLALTNMSDASPPSLEAYNLANDLLDLITFIESYLGSGYAARLVAALKPWLPDLVLALGSRHLLNRTLGEGAYSTATEISKLHSSSWPSILAKIELCELIEVTSDKEADGVSKAEEFSAFKKLMGMIMQFLQANVNVMDVIGMIFFNVVVLGLERKDFELVLGLVHFVCVKLLGHEVERWEELNMMLTYLQDIYPEIERISEENRSSEGETVELQRAKALLEPVWMHYIHETREDPVEEQ